MGLQWIKLHCQKWFFGSTRWELNEAERSIWIDCLARAGLNDPTGQIDFYSIQQLADQFNTSPQLLEETLQKFIKLEKISIDKKTIILLNWNRYQSDVKRHREPIRNNINNSPIKRKSNIKNSPKKRIDKKKIDKKKIDISAFGVFWEAYPRKAAKIAAEKAWLKLNADNGTLQKILAAIAAFKESAEWKKDNGQFIPYPATWLNNRRWEDEIPAVAPPTPEKRRRCNYDNSRACYYDCTDCDLVKNKLKNKGGPNDN